MLTLWERILFHFLDIFFPNVMTERGSLTVRSSGLSFIPLSLLRPFIMNLRHTPKSYLIAVEFHILRMFGNRSSRDSLAKISPMEGTYGEFTQAVIFADITTV